VTYSEDVLVFVAITVVFALIWGYLMQKTGSLWGSALFHAGADTLIIIGMFSGKDVKRLLVGELSRRFVRCFREIRVAMLLRNPSGSGCSDRWGQ